MPIADEQFVFESPVHRGCVLRAFYLPEMKDARVEIRRGDEIVMSGLTPAYKVWNYYHHAADLIDDNLDSSPDSEL